MLQTLTLRRYRGFESYRLADLTRVNLIVGKNNSGKTSILEAVELLVAAGHVTAFHEAARRRGAPAPHYRKDRSPALSNLFFGYECKPGAHFELSSEDGKLNLSVHVMHLDGLEDVNRSHPESAFALSIVSAKDEKTTLPITEDGSIIGYRQSVPAPRRNGSLENPVHFLALESFSFAAMEQAWEDNSDPRPRGRNRGGHEASYAGHRLNPLPGPRKAGRRRYTGGTPRRSPPSPDR